MSELLKLDETLQQAIGDAVPVVGHDELEAAAHRRHVHEPLLS